MNNSAAQLKKVAQLEGLVGLMDSQFSIFGYSFGLDGLIGLIPGVGDIVGGLISVIIVLRLRSIGIKGAVIDKMLRNILIDVFVGTVPGIGDLFDFAFKVNERNLRLAKQSLQ